MTCEHYTKFKFRCPQIKFYRNKAMLIYFRITWDCFCPMTAELSSCDKDQTFCEAQYICYLALYRKSLSTSGLLQPLPHNPDFIPFKSEILRACLLIVPD